jgi:Domain of unknown function (DU1801)
MSTIKTTTNDTSVEDFINTVDDQTRQHDTLTLIKIYSRLTGEQPKMWGSSIIGFGQYHYKSEHSDQEGDWALVGFSPRKQNLTLYFMTGFGNYTDLLGKLGKHKTSVSCLYIKQLSDIDQKILETLITTEFTTMKETYTQ